MARPAALPSLVSDDAGSRNLAEARRVVATASPSVPPTIHPAPTVVLARAGGPTPDPTFPAPPAPLPVGPFEPTPPAVVDAGIKPGDSPAPDVDVVVPNPPAEGCAGCEEGPTCCDDSCCAPRFWFNAEYLLWWFKDSPEPAPLVTTSAAAAVPGRPPPGAVGGPGSQLVLGGPVDLQEHRGGRFQAGYALEPDGSLGVEGGYFFLATRVPNQVAVSDGGPVSRLLVVPTFNPVNGRQTVGVVANLPAAVPGVLAASFAESLASRLQGAEVNGVCGAEAPWGRVDVLAGFRWLDLHETLGFTAAATGVPGSALCEGVVFDTLDRFDARNHFYGGQVGARSGYAFGPVVVTASLKVALGDMHEEVDVFGTTRTAGLAQFGIPAGTAAGGIFAQPANMGRHNRDQFAVIPEAGARVGYQFASWVRASAGYDFLYLSEAARPGNQIDRGINPTQTGLKRSLGVTPVRPARPAFAFQGSDFWAQGLDLGLELRY